MIVKKLTCSPWVKLVILETVYPLEKSVVLVALWPVLVRFSKV